MVNFEHTSPETAQYYRFENFNIEDKIELIDSCKALFQLKELLCSMILDCRTKKSKTIRLDEEDLHLLYQIARKQKQINFSEEEK